MSWHFKYMSNSCTNYGCHRRRFYARIKRALPIIFGCAAVQFWTKLDRRLYFNELQQAQTDSFMGAQGDALDNEQQHVRRLDNELCAHAHGMWFSIQLTQV